MSYSLDIAMIAPLYLPEPHASLLNGMILGISLKHNREFYNASIESGLVHLVVVSGSNVSLISSFMLSVLFFVKKQVAIVISIVAIVSFMFLVGVQPPVFRATVMNIMFLFGLLIGRKYISLYSLGLSALISAVIMPNWLSSLSFYLTYLSSSGMILFAKPLTDTSKKLSTAGKVKRYLFTEIWTTISAQIFLYPLFLFYFGRISFISIITNLLVSWAVLPIMVLGFLMIILHYLNTSLASFVASIAFIPLHYIITIVYFFS